MNIFRNRAVVGFALWSFIIVVGSASLEAYEHLPAHQLKASQVWPETTLKRGAGNTLVMFAHPRCPCTRASLHQLQKLLGAISSRPLCYVVFLKPPGWDDKQLDTDIFRTAKQIAGVETVFDEGGAIARSFASTTSGDTFLFGPGGGLIFRGGITASRGDESDCASYELLANAMEKTPITDKLAQTPVFGCSLVNSQGVKSCRR